MIVRVASSRRPASSAPSSYLSVGKQIAVAITLIVFLIPMSAEAKCGYGLPPDYDDVTQVILTQTGCGSTLTPGSPLTLACSRYWAAFSDDLDTLPKEVNYSQYNLENAVGAYRLAVSMVDAKRILNRNHFYALNPPVQDVPTDTAVATISVTRCAITTSLKVYMPPAKPAIEPQVTTLFNDFRSLIANAAKKQITEKPEVPYDGFEPWY